MREKHYPTYDLATNRIGSKKVIGSMVLIFYAISFSYSSEAKAQAKLINGLGGPAGYGTDNLGRIDDGPSFDVDLTPIFPSGLDFYGKVYNNLYVNNNGNVTLPDSSSTYSPSELGPGRSKSSPAIFAPYWSDVDTRPAPNKNSNRNLVYVSTDVASKRIIATWYEVGYYSMKTNHVNSYQMILTNREDINPRSFQVEFRYNSCEWTTGDASGGFNGLCSVSTCRPAVMGWDAMDRSNYYQHPDSLSDDILDLCTTSNVGEPGVWRFIFNSGNSCGNGRVDRGEDCDDGNLSNTDDCLNTCINASCGDGHIWAGMEECDDGNTLSGDGCSNICTNESMEQCPGTPIDISSISPNSGSTVSVTGSTISAFDYIDERRNIDCWPNSERGGPEHIYLIRPSRDISLQIDTLGSSFDTMLVVANPCPDGSNYCRFNNDYDSTLQAGLNCFSYNAGSSYSIIITGNRGDTGNYSLNLTECAMCGNGFLEAGEDCDDGNSLPNDGCTNCLVYEDLDGDGQYADVDCDDHNNAMYPGAMEVCDGIDNDCDGDIDENLSIDGDGDGHYAVGACSMPNDDCDDSNAAIHPGASELCDGLDNNCDGNIDEGLSTDDDGDGHYLPGSCAFPDDDCDDMNPSVHPGAQELCDGLDNNCDTNIDEGLSVDGDGDGHYALGACLAPADDCDDTNPSVFHGAPELCDGIDNNCNGNIDEGLSTDNDGDGHYTIGSCATPHDDCDDSNLNVYLGAVEICDGIDNNCDGSIDEDLSFDSDGDGHYTLGSCLMPNDDCNDNNPSVYPGASEICDGLDNDCNTAIDEGLSTDGDGDGHYTIGSCATPHDDCDDSNMNVYPGALEICDGLDNNCDGRIDEGLSTDADGDGHYSRASCSSPNDDCDDNAPTVYPGSAELCDGIDNDCDGIIPSDELDADGDGQFVCQGDCDDNEPVVGLGFPELCDGLDNDCDGEINGETEDNDSDGQTPCEGDCDDSEPTVYLGAPEICDGLDNDCDGELGPDELDEDNDAQMVCEGDCDDFEETIGFGFPELCDGFDNDCDGNSEGETEDVDGDGQTPCEGDCNDLEASVYLGAEELCDGLDNDCDGVLMDGEIDEDEDGFLLCEDDCDDENNSIHPEAIEVCNGRDDDCDGHVPENEIDSDGDGQAPCEGDCDDSNPNIYLGADENEIGIDMNCDNKFIESDQPLGISGFECGCRGAGDSNSTLHFLSWLLELLFL